MSTHRKHWFSAALVAVALGSVAMAGLPAAASRAATDPPAQDPTADQSEALDEAREDPAGPVVVPMGSPQAGCTWVPGMVGLAFRCPATRPEPGQPADAAPYEGVPVRWADVEESGVAGLKAGDADEEPVNDAEGDDVVLVPGPGDLPESDGAPSDSRLAPLPCFYGFICVWTGGYLQGPNLAIGQARGRGFTWNVAESACARSGRSGPTWRNCASSVVNTSGNLVSLFTNASQQGYSFNLAHGTVKNQLGAFDNEIESSFRW